MRKILLSFGILLLIFGCSMQDSDEFGYAQTKQDLYYGEYSDLRGELAFYDNPLIRIGTVYYDIEQDGLSYTGWYPLEEHVSIDTSAPCLEELIQNNSKQRLDQRLSPELLKVFEIASTNNAGVDSEINIILLFLDDLKLPRLKELDADEAKTSDKNARILETNLKALSILSKIREFEINSKLSTLSSLDMKVLHIYSLINAVELRVKASDLHYFVNREDVQYISLANEKVPINDINEKMEGLTINQRNLANNISDGRALIKSDPYFSYTGGWVSVIDTGSRIDHDLLTNRFAYRRDCYNATNSTCTAGSALNPTDDSGHGSSSSSIVSGSNALGNQSRGVSNVIMDSFKVYYFDEDDGLFYANMSASLRAYEASIAANDRVILAELQFDSAYNASLAMAANNAFDLGFATIAVAGNYGPSEGSIASPGNAQKALAIGAYDVNTPYNLMNYSSRGPTEDGRVKPDIIAPTNTRAADVISGSNTLRVFGGTSGAAPYAAGAAALLRNRMRGTSQTIDPGILYAGLINAATEKITTNFNNNHGAGKLRLPTNSSSWWGATTVNQNIATVTIDIGNLNYQDFSVTVWWPESPNQSHKTFRIGMRNFNCGAWSGYWPYSIPENTWQKHVFTQICQGEWKLQIIPENTVNRNQTVYYNITFWTYGH